MGQIELFNHLLNLKLFNCVQIELLVQDRNTWNHLTVSKQMSSSLFKNVTYKLFVYKLHTHTHKHTHICVCVRVLNNLPRLYAKNTQPTLL